MIEVRDLKKTFVTRKKRVEALKGVSLEASPGEIYGLIGPNGAGKTTALRTMATLLKPDSGGVTVGGLDTVRDSRRVREMIGFLTSEMKLSGNLSTRDMLHFFGRLNHLDPDRVARRVAELVDRFDMAEFLDRPIAKLSTGMKQKASISVSIVHDPKVIVFDEPTAGLDILASKIVTDYLLDARKRGRTVLLSTHFMNVAEKLCDRIGFLVEGRLLENGPKEAIIAKYGTETLESAFFSLAKEMINHA